METPNYMTPFWEQVIEESERKITHAKQELAKLAIKSLSDEEKLEALNNRYWDLQDEMANIAIEKANLMNKIKEQG